jgi:hypothetical protein
VYKIHMHGLKRTNRLKIWWPSVKIFISPLFLHDKPLWVSDFSAKLKIFFIYIVEFF